MASLKENAANVANFLKNYKLLLEIILIPLFVIILPMIVHTKVSLLFLTIDRFWIIIYPNKRKLNYYVLVLDYRVHTIRY